MPLLIVLTFAIAGPPLGLACLLSMAAIGSFFAAPSASMPPLPFKWSYVFSKTTVLVFAFTYALGGAQAIITGLAAASSFGASDRAGVSLRVVLSTAAATGAVFLLVILSDSKYQPVTISMIPTSAFLMIVHLAAALICWFVLTIAIARATRPNTPPDHETAHSGHADSR